MAAIRAEPRDDAEQVTQALRGEPLTVEERTGGWAKVRTAYGYPGWMRESALGPHVVADWLGSQTERKPVDAARAFLGARYEWGGMSERGIDCSGLVHMAYRRVGELVPRDAHEQEAAGRAIEEDELRPGDLITYGDGEQADHIAFWLGAGRILHSTAREGVHAVVEECEPVELRARRRRLVRLAGPAVTRTR